MEEKAKQCTILINLIGQPSSGKSTAAAKLFSMLKDEGLDVEMALEYCKGYIWEQREVTPYSQYYFVGKQSHLESQLFNKVSYIVSDSPTLLASFYHFHNTGSKVLSPLCKEFYKKATEDGVKILNFYLPRKKKYNPKGRYQTQEEADLIGKQLLEWLDEEGYSYEILDCSEKERLERVLQRIKEIRG